MSLECTDLGCCLHQANLSATPSSAWRPSAWGWKVTNPNDTLIPLWKLSEQGTKEWWPKNLHDDPLVYRFGEDVFGLNMIFEDPNDELSDQQLLDLVDKSCERWLVGKGWETRHLKGFKVYIYEDGDHEYLQTRSLPEAIEYAQQQ